MKNILKIIFLTILMTAGLALAGDDYSLDKKVDSPVRAGFAVTPHDSNTIATISRALYIGGAGDVAVILLDDSAAITFVGVAAGTVLPIRAKVIKVTGTTATNILALY